MWRVNNSTKGIAAIKGMPNVALEECVIDAQWLQALMHTVTPAVAVIRGAWGVGESRGLLAEKHSFIRSPLPKEAAALPVANMLSIF